MPRQCGPCGDKRRNEIDRRLLEMDVTGETYRLLSSEYGYSEKALARHKQNHLTVDLAAAKQAVEEAKAEAVRKAQEEMKKAVVEGVKVLASDCMAARMENATNYLDQIREIRRSAAEFLDKAEQADDLRAGAVYLRELREQIRLWAELDGKIASQPTVNIMIDPQWIELRTKIVTALEPYPAAKEAVIDAIKK